MYVCHRVSILIIIVNNIIASNTTTNNIIANNITIKNIIVNMNSIMTIQCVSCFCCTCF